MAKLHKLFVLASLLVPIPLSHLHAQTPTPAPANGSVTAVNPAPAAQAPDEATRKISELVLAGKYAEAQQLTNGLLIAYPGDQRLIKAKALIDSRLSPGGSTGTAHDSAQPNQPGANTNIEQLTGMDKVDYNALIVLARQARQTTDLDEQKKLLQQFMDQSAPFLQKHPDLTLLWQLRGASAISLDDMVAGYAAGQKLLSMGAADSNDPALQQLLGELKNKGWLDAQKVEDHQRKVENNRKQLEYERFTFPVVRGQKGYAKGFGHLTFNENDAVYVGNDRTIRFSKDELSEIKIECWGFACGLSFEMKDETELSFIAVTESAVADRKYRTDRMGSLDQLENAVVERWRVEVHGKVAKPSFH